MRNAWIALVFVGCSGSSEVATSPAPGTAGDGSGSASSAAGSQASQASQGRQPSQGSQAMSQNRETPGNTGVDPDGVLLRSKPDPNAPKPDPALVADDAANLLFSAAGLLGDPALQRRVWQQLGLADASGNPTPRMTAFLRANEEWVKVKAHLVATVATPDKARAYVDAHLKK